MSQQGVSALARVSRTAVTQLFPRAFHASAAAQAKAKGKKGAPADDAIIATGFCDFTMVGLKYDHQGIPFANGSNKNKSD